MRQEGLRSALALCLGPVDRLVHRATIFELNVESYRRRTAVAATQRRRGRIAKHASPTNTDVAPRTKRASKTTRASGTAKA